VEIKQNPNTDLTETAISEFLKRLQRYNLIRKDEDGKYHLTRLGFVVLAHRRDKPIVADELKMRRKKDFEALWNEAYILHERILRLIWRPGADESSKVLMEASGGGPGLILVGALKAKDGTHVFTFQTVDTQHLEKLGYVDHKPSTKESP
jgi:hypothetical protein